MIPGLLERLEATFQQAIETAVMTGRILPSCTDAARDLPAEALTVEEMQSAILGALTGQNWRVSSHIADAESAYRVGDLYVCGRDFAESAIAALKARSATTGATRQVREGG